MGLVTGSGGYIDTSAFGEEYRSGNEAVIADGEWKLKGIDDFTVSGLKPFTIKSKSGKGNCKILTEGDNYLLSNNSNLLRVEGLTVQCSNPEIGGNFLRFGVSGYGNFNRNFAIGDCGFLGYGRAKYQHGAITTRGFANGLFYNVYVKNYSVRQVDHYGFQLDGNNKYTRDIRPYLDPATAFDYLIVIEDSEFENCQHTAPTDRGASQLFRRNKIHHNMWGQAIDAHGGNGSNQYSTVIAIIEDNEIYDPIDGTEKAMAFRGGAFFVTGNKVDGYKNLGEMVIEPNLTSKEIAELCLIHDSYVWNNTGSTSRVAVYGCPGAYACQRLGMDANQYIKLGENYFLHAPSESLYTPLGEHPLRNGVTPGPDPDPEPDPEPAGNTTFKIFVNGDISGELIIGPDIGMTGHLSANIDIKSEVIE